MLPHFCPPNPHWTPNCVVIVVLAAAAADAAASDAAAAAAAVAGAAVGAAAATAAAAAAAAATAAAGAAVAAAVAAAAAAIHSRGLMCRPLFVYRFLLCGHFLVLPRPTARWTRLSAPQNGAPIAMPCMFLKLYAPRLHESSVFALRIPSGPPMDRRSCCCCC